MKPQVQAARTRTECLGTLSRLTPHVPVAGYQGGKDQTTATPSTTKMMVDRLCRRGAITEAQQSTAFDVAHRMFSRTARPEQLRPSGDRSAGQAGRVAYAGVSSSRFTTPKSVSSRTSWEARNRRSRGSRYGTGMSLLAGARTPSRVRSCGVPMTP